MEIRKGFSVDRTRIPRDRLIRNRLKDSHNRYRENGILVDNPGSLGSILPFKIYISYFEYIFQFVLSVDYKIFMQIICYEEFTIAFKLIETPKYTISSIFPIFFKEKALCWCSICNPFITLELVQTFDITSATVMHVRIEKNFCSNLAWKLVYRVRNILKEDGDGDRRGWIDRRLRRKGGTGPRSASWNSMKLHIPFRRGQRRWFEYQRSLALFFSPRWFLDRNFDEIGEAKGETKLSLILDTGSSLLTPSSPPKNGSQRIRHAAEIKEVAKFSLRQFSKSNYLTIRHTDPRRGYFIKTCNPIQKRGRR